MHLKRLELTHYRNYQQLSIAFDNKINVLIGENAQGKTNILESIYVLAMAKSHRTSNDKELIQWQESFTRIEGIIEKRQQTIPLELMISMNGKKAKANHLEQRKLSNYIGHANIVMFAPEDLNLVKGIPQIRRRFLDMEIGQVSPVYLHEINQYQKILQQRNAELKRMNFLRIQDDSILIILTEQLIESAVKILRKRFEFLEILSKRAIPIHKEISHQLENLEIQYQSSADVSENMDLGKIITHFEEKFVKIRSREIERGLTLIGPHRDDLIFYLNGQDVQSFGSQGQQRTTALSLKLAEIELIYDEIGEYPILLLDDVLSELDDARQSHLLNTIQGKVQTFITTTSVEGIEHETLQQAARFVVENGAIQL